MELIRAWEHGMKAPLVGLVLASGALAACGPGASGDTGSSGGSGGDTAMSGGQGNLASGGMGASSTGGSSSGGAGTDTGGADTGTGGETAVPLPEGSVEALGIVNLVDTDAYAELESYLRQEEGATLAPLVQRFYQYYPDEYDFLFFVTHAPVADTGVSAAFTTIHRPVIPGTGIDKAAHAGGYGSHGRLKGAIGAQGDVNSGMPPFDHELLHYWGAYLSADFGFQHDPDFDITGHWGYASVGGQLGGFDGATLACVVPEGAMPPDCTPEADGSTHYRTSAFAPNTNSFKGVPFAPLELYIMGLIPKEDVLPITVLDVPHYLESGEDYSIVSAESLSEVTIDDIVEVHGERAPTPEDERHFAAAFVLVSPVPADTAVLEQVAEWAAIWGARQAANGSWTSFAEKTGDRMTLSTELGRRRVASDPAPLPPLPETCDPVAQDCGEELIGCFASSCLSSGGIAVNAACQYANDCTPGAACFGNLCRAYCTADDATSDKYCETLCPGASVEATHSDGTTARICMD